MKQFFIKISLVLYVLFGISSVNAQDEKFNYLITLNAGISSDEALPFWLVSNRYGSVPDSDFGLLNASLYSNFKKPSKDFGIAYKVSATGYLAEENALLINEMYLRLQYKN